MTQPQTRRQTEGEPPPVTRQSDLGLGNLDRDFDGDIDARTLLRVLQPARPVAYEAAA